MSICAGNRFLLKRIASLKEILSHIKQTNLLTTDGIPEQKAHGKQHTNGGAALGGEKYFLIVRETVFGSVS